MRSAFPTQYPERLTYHDTVCPQDHLPAPAAAVQVGARGHGARERARREHRDLRAQRVRRELEQGYRSVSTYMHT